MGLFIQLAHGLANPQLWRSAPLISLLIFLALISPQKAGAYHIEDNVITHAQQGGKLLQLRRYNEAIEEFKIGLRLNPYSSLSASLYNNLGVSYQKTRNFPMAFSSYQRAIRIHPDFELYYKNLIQSYADAKKLSKARNRMRHILTINPKDSEAWYLMGLIFEKTGEEKEAKAAFSRFLELEPNSRLARSAKNHL